MDAAKGPVHPLPAGSTGVLDKNGVLITDNVLQDGDNIESRSPWNAGTARSTNGCGNTYLN